MTGLDDALEEFGGDGEAAGSAGAGVGPDGGNFLARSVVLAGAAEEVGGHFQPDVQAKLASDKSLERDLVQRNSLMKRWSGWPVG